MITKACSVDDVPVGAALASARGARRGPVSADTVDDEEDGEEEDGEEDGEEEDGDRVVLGVGGVCVGVGMGTFITPRG